MAMTMREVHEYRTAGRRPLTVCGWSATLALTGLASLGGLTPSLAFLGLASTAGLGWHLHATRATGCRIGRTAWLLWRGRRRVAIPLSDIASVDMGEGWTAVHTDGRRTPLPAACLPPDKTLVKWLASRGIAISGQRPSGLAPDSRQAANAPPSAE